MNERKRLVMGIMLFCIGLGIGLYRKHIFAQKMWFGAKLTGIVVILIGVYLCLDYFNAIEELGLKKPKWLTGGKTDRVNINRKSRSHEEMAIMIREKAKSHEFNSYQYLAKMTIGANGESKELKEYGVKDLSTNTEKTEEAQTAKKVAPIRRKVISRQELESQESHGFQTDLFSNVLNKEIEDEQYHADMKMLSQHEREQKIKEKALEIATKPLGLDPKIQDILQQADKAIQQENKEESI